MKKYFQLFCLALTITLTGASAASAQQPKNIQEVTPSTPASLKVIELKPGTAKNLPVLFTVATKTRLFLTIADDLNLSNDQRTQLNQINDNLQTRVRETKTNYDKQNEGLHAILSTDHIALEDMRENLRNAEQLKAEMQYYLFESLVRAANVLTSEQQQKILDNIKIDDVK